MKTQITLVMFLFIFASQAQAANLYLPSVCGSQQTLTLTNLSNEEVPLWLQYQSDKGFEEERWVLKKKETKILEADLLPTSPFSIKSHSAGLLAISRCGSLVLPWSPQVSSLRHWNQNNGKTYKLSVQNLNPYKQTIMLRFLDAEKRVVSERTETLSAYMSTQHFKFSGLGQELEVRAQGRIAAQLLEHDSGVSQVQKELPTLPIKVLTKNEGAYFLMSDLDNTESFVIHINDTEMVQRARDIIAKGEWKLMVADISYSASSENRNLNTASVPYSWKVERVVNFNDLAHISCDGSPQGVQDKIHSWLQSKRICFWNYHLSRELSPHEVTYGVLKP